MKQRRSTRRRFLKLGSAASLTAISAPLLGNTKSSASADFPEGTTILFQGDSITDAGRNRGNYYANNGSGMGGGYVYQIVAEMLAQHPKSGLKCYNRGISGNKVFQLAKRWEEDCLQLKPTVLSILIGVNDYWHTLSNNYQGTPETFDRDLRALLTRTKEQLPDTKIILGEPFAVAGGTALTPAWDQDFSEYQQSVKEISQEIKAAFVPFQKTFDSALERAPVSHWCPDGVHPSIAGSVLMKDAWLEAFNQLW